MLVIKDLKYKFSLNNKNTARCPEQYVAADDANNLYLVVHARTDTQIFYAKRAIENQEIFDEHEHTDFKCNLPLFSGFLEDGFYAIYHYFENANEINDEYPHYWLLDFYKNNSFEINICDEEIEKIEEGFLNAFPEKYRNQIKLLKEFKLFRDELSKHNKLSVCFQHGDFTPNNLLIVNSSTRYIMDFEFSQRHQPIGFDLFDFHYSTDKNYSNIPYLNINKIKEELQNKVNELIDSFSHPKLINNNEEMASFEPTHWSDDIIYNRPDLYEPMNFYLRVVYEGCIYVVRYYIKRYKAVICVWLRPIPSQVLDFVIDYVFKKHRFVMKIDIKYSTVNYKNTFIQDNNWVVFLPSQPNDIINRLSKKSKYNLKREMRLLEDECGTLSVFHYTKEYIPRFIFDLYFEWKKNHMEQIMECLQKNT